MPASTHNTALLLFTRTPRDEAQHKFLLNKGNGSRQEKIYRKLLQHTRQLGQHSGLPFYIIDSGAQQGHTFGERFYRALESVFNLGFENVIAIGNDCTQLRAADIRQAAGLLQTNAAVLGPAQDGGVYLVGLQKKLFTHQAGFLQINWQTATVLTELQDWAKPENSVTLPFVYSIWIQKQICGLPFFRVCYRFRLLNYLLPYFSSESIIFISGIF